MAIAETAFSFVTQPAPDVDWQVAAYHIREGLSEPYECVLDLASRERVDLASLLGMPTEFVILRDAQKRAFRGVVRSAVDLGSTPGRRHTRLHVVPALWALSQRSDCRIYQALNALDVVKEVLRAAGIYQDSGQIDDAGVLVGDLKPRECCVQYHESDLDFVARLLEEEGITYFFKHDAAGTLNETLVLVSDGAADPFREKVPTLDGRAVPVMGSGGETLDTESVRHVELALHLQPTSVTLRDWDFTRPFDPQAASPGRETVTTVTRSTGSSARTIYHHPATTTFTDYDEGALHYGGDDLAHQAQLISSGFRGRELLGRGRGVVTGFMPGRRVSLVNEDGDEQDPVVLSTVEHRGLVRDSAQGADVRRDANPDERYANSFSFVPVDRVYRPARRAKRQRVQGPQTATVMAKPGSSEEICVDAYGRVLVRFHWERPDTRSSSQASKYASCWVRAAQSWAGNGWGVVFNPRVGMEVVVQFLDGDPDRPLVTGCVYNLHNKPPPLDELIEKRTRSTIRTNSSPGGDGFNELYFEDSAGHEQIYLHAQRDLDEDVLHNHTEHVRCNETITVDGNQRTTVGGDQTIHVHGVQTITVDGNKGQAGKHGSVTVTGDMTLEATNEIMIKAPAKITLDCSGTTITLEPGKITLNNGSSLFIMDGGDIMEMATTISESATADFNIFGNPVTIDGGPLVDVKAGLIKLNS